MKSVETLVDWDGDLVAKVSDGTLWWYGSKWDEEKAKHVTAWRPLPLPPGCEPLDSLEPDVGD